jgi:hypothetical protein
LRNSPPGDEQARNPESRLPPAWTKRSREIERSLELPLLAFALLTIPAIALDAPGVGEPWKTVGTIRHAATTNLGSAI